MLAEHALTGLGKRVMRIRNGGVDDDGKQEVGITTAGIRTRSPARLAPRLFSRPHRCMSLLVYVPVQEVKVELHSRPAFVSGDFSEDPGARPTPSSLMYQVYPKQINEEAGKSKKKKEKKRPMRASFAPIVTVLRRSADTHFPSFFRDSPSSPCDAHPNSTLD